jgi:uncharacterized membrane protein YfcA
MPEQIFIVNFLIIAIGIIISLYGSLVGFGGGIFMVPVLVTVFHYDLQFAVGAVMIALLPSTLISTYLHRKEGNVDFRMGILLEIPTVIGVIIGSLLIGFLPAKQLEIFFSVVISILGFSFLLKKDKTNSPKSSVFYKLNLLPPRIIIKNQAHFFAYRVSIWMAGFFGLLAGSLAGLFGIGGGFLKTPIMIKVFGMPAKVAAATGLFMILITSATGSFTHYLQGHIIFDKTWPVVVGFAVGAMLGNKINLGLENSKLEKLVGLGLVLAALIMLSNLLLK